MTTPPTPDPSAAAPISSLLAPRVALFLLAIAVHANGVFGKFIFDDIPSIVNNPAVHSLTPVGRMLFGGRDNTLTGRPLSSLTFALNYAWSGDQPWSYHVFNIVLHASVALVLFEATVLLFRLRAMPGVLRSHATSLAFTSAALWAVHPLTTSAVVYCVQRAESLCGLCFVIVFFALLRDAERDEFNSPRTIWLGLVVLACWAGVAAKEVMATAPLLAVAFDRIFLSPSWRVLLVRRGVVYAGMFASWLWLGWLMTLSESRDGSAGLGTGVSSREYLLTQFAIIPEYLLLVCVPTGLCCDWGYPLYTEPREWGYGLALLLALATATVLALFTVPRWAFVGLWFFVILAPTSSLIPISTQTAAEHRMYIPLMGLLVGFVVAVALVVDRSARRLSPLNLRVASVRGMCVAGMMLVLLVSVFAMISVRRNALYADPVALWIDAARNRPDSIRALRNAGISEMSIGNWEPALVWLDLSINHPRVVSGEWLNASNIRDHAKTHFRRAFALSKLGRHGEALSAFDDALRIQPEDEVSRLHRARLLVDLERFNDAISDCDFLLAREQFPQETLNLRGYSLLRIGDAATALGDARYLAEHGWALSDRFAAEIRARSNRDTPPPGAKPGS
jgi:protein O-mannosyl-transferase